MATQDKYDRQIRLWGSHGQRILSSSSICLLGVTPAGSEALKNLILPCIGKFTIIDNKTVSLRDMGNNFFVTKEDQASGRSRAEACAANLSELNPDVQS